MVIFSLLAGPLALVCATYVLITTQKSAIKNGSIWGAVKTMITFIIMFCFLILVVPMLFNWGVIKLYNGFQTGTAAAIIGQTVNNGQTVIESVVGSGITMPTMPSLPEAAPVAPLAPSSPSAPVMRAESSTTWGNAPAAPRSAAPAAPAKPDYSTAAPVSAPAAAPVAPTTWGNGLGTDNSGNAIQGPAAPANYAPLGTDAKGTPIQGPAAPSFFDSPTIKAITQPDGGPLATDANATTWAGSPTVQTIANYQVQRGDTMFKIAKWWYGNGNRWIDICNANTVRDCNNLAVGTVLALP